MSRKKHYRVAEKHHECGHGHCHCGHHKQKHHNPIICGILFVGVATAVFLKGILVGCFLAKHVKGLSK